MNEEVEDLIALNPRFDYGREKKSNLCLCYTPPLMIVFIFVLVMFLINEIYYNHFMYVDVLFPLVGVHNCVNSAFIHLTNGKKKDPPIQRLILNCGCNLIHHLTVIKLHLLWHTLN